MGEIDWCLVTHKTYSLEHILLYYQQFSKSITLYKLVLKNH